MTAKAPPVKVPKKWIRDASDELAAAEGCRFDIDRGQFVIDFIQKNLCLYEGEIELDDEGNPLPVVLMEWQKDFLYRLFGWVRYSKRFKRWVRRFRKASLWIPKKNGKSPTAAMIGLYLLCADGEPGQKVYSAAKDGKQALIMHTHAEMMVRKSEALSEECVINMTTHTIRHSPTDSIYIPISGDNINSQEGLNGSVIIDETHVVDERLAKVLEYAGASRSEPIHLEVSTAGSNLMGYGKKQYDYGKDVYSGKIENTSFLYVCYEAPEGTTEKNADSPEVLKAANPSLGVTVDMDELQSTFASAKRSLSDLANWMMYRLNVWQGSDSPAIRIEDWKACRHAFTPEDLHGLPCFGGLDMARTRDMCSFSLLFPWEDGYRHLCHSWLPENSVDQYPASVPIRQWERDGWITIHSGNSVDYRDMVARIVEMCAPYKVRMIGYDRLNADIVASILQEEHGLPVEEFIQTMTHFAGPTGEFERLICDGHFYHHGNPVMDWQVGHVKWKTDANNNKRPVKPTHSHNSYQKIDSVASAIMALGEAMTAEPEIDINAHVAQVGGFVFA